MLDQLTTPEAVTVLALLMVGADGETKLEELASMLGNPFFKEHVAEKIGHPQNFIKKYNDTKTALGTEKLEDKAVSALKSAFPAFRVKTLALMSIIAGADNDFDQKEKELVARVSTALGVSMDDVGPEIEKMNEALTEAPPAEESKEAPQEPASPEDATETPAEEVAPETAPEESTEAPAEDKPKS